MPKLYEYRSEFYRLARNVPIVVHSPKEENKNRQIAVLAMHRSRSDYSSFPLLLKLAEHGFVAAASHPNHTDVGGWLSDYKAAVDFLKTYPGIKKLVLLGHSQGGCMMSCYQYIAENGTGRFKSTDRIIPFPDVPPLTPADGLMLMDSNWGIMEVLCLDPAVRLMGSGWGRKPELDLYNPENGYAPDGSHYTQDFIERFQKAQISFYQDIVNYARERFEKITAGTGDFADDEPVTIAGGGMGSDNNKLFIQDVSLLGRTRLPRPTLLPDGSVAEKIAYTVRKPKDSVRQQFYRGAFKTTVKELLMEERRFGDFGYNEFSMWGDDWDFNYLRTCANLKGIHVPLLCTGNTGSHEFVNAEMNYENAVSEDKSLIIIEGADHNFISTDADKYGDTAKNAGNYIAAWLNREGRFI